MDARFDEIYTDPENQVFRVVFYPDRIYHARYLNATRSSRYRYNVREVRSIAEITVMKGEVYLDGNFLTNFIRYEYLGTRLQEVARERGRFLQEEVMGWTKLHATDSSLSAEAYLKLYYCPWIRAYQVELWETLQPPPGVSHDIKVLDMMGARNAITRIRQLSPALAKIKEVKQVEVAFSENETDLPFGYQIKSPEWDDNYMRSYQQPESSVPSDNQKNTKEVKNYLLNFQRGWYLHTDSVQPVRYRNAMMNDNDSRRFDDNVIEMKWVLQRELGSDMVFFHEVTIPPHTIEGTHRHIGSEELYYITEGEGTAYMGEGDDPATDGFPTVELPIYGLDTKKCKEVPVKPGSVIFTKSGGIHGIRNNTDKNLRFVAFLYHSA
jgi:mannose-6-phosphate isomerase-like protein (cupin superfamily)